VWELELPMMRAPHDFFELFYADDAEWATLQHRERGDKSAIDLPNHCCLACR
jgi:hypothetical protein